MYDEDYYGIDTYLAPNDGKLFQEFGNVVFPSKFKILRIKNEDTRISIFLEQRSTPHVTFFVGKVQNFVFLYKFKGIENTGGATVIRSLLDEEARAKLLSTYKEAESAFSKVHYKLDALANHKLIYYGAINEG